MEVYRRLPEELKGMIDRMVHRAALRAVHEDLKKCWPKVNIFRCRYHIYRYEYGINEIRWDEDYLYWKLYCVCYFNDTPEETICQIWRLI